MDAEIVLSVGFRYDKRTHFHFFGAFYGCRSYNLAGHCFGSGSIAPAGFDGLGGVRRFGGEAQAVCVACLEIERWSEEPVILRIGIAVVAPYFETAV